MQRLNRFIFFTILVFVFAVSGPAGADETAMPSDSGKIDVSSGDKENFNFIEDNRVLDLKDAFSNQLQTLLAEIEDTLDSHQRETLQKIIHQIKAEQEIAVKELYLDMAIEEGDTAAEAKILEVLDSLYDPEFATPAFSEPTQELESGDIKPESPSKNPDDA